MQDVRIATIYDSEAIQGIYSQSIQNAEWLPTDAQYEVNFAKASDGEKIYVYTNREERVLGFISVWVEESFIHHLYVSPEAQRTGIGKRLLGSLHSWLPLPWQLKCVLRNTSALSFYKTHGFVAISTHESEIPPYALLRKSEA
jgi:ribosomal protein S18 acetylase RimI-like enzyme